ncbi:putative cysteine-rich receptor-like protein kinase 12 isoform X2 [Phragmites australis]|uniref:putative cysteine-rich receptor-like protein kinase 12 isoform X2 n=1 Tax=Phragmites australis TaxID=29695 RepID=UPI002D79BA01|nr:putative cysteine-rich receptor-like protein kinase 12 isoform X2 [Phragmites australis]
MLLVALLLLSSPMLLAEGQSFCSNTNILHMPNSTYMSNLNSLAKALFANVTNSNSHSANGTAGTSPNKVYGVVICRGDTAPGNDCANRLNKVLDAAINNNASSSCSSQKNITLFGHGYLAQLRFSDQDFISSFSNAPECTMMVKLTDSMVSKTIKYKTGEGWLSETSQTVYGLVQCTEGMLPEACQDCLRSTITKREQMVGSGQMGGAILGVHCSLWYQTGVQFFAGHPMLSLSMPTPNKFWIWITIGSFSVIVSVSWLLIHIWIKTERKRERARYELQLLSIAIQNVLNLWRIEEGNSGFSLYDFAQIKEATDNFSSENKLGQGGFGPVYKGLLPGGLEVAVKRLAACSVQGLLEFKNEIQLIAKLQHKNLVKLLGCCIQGDQEKMLVYEYMQNKSLDLYIFDSKKRAQLNWSMRLHIIDGIAQGILYLHKHSRLCIVHRDLKASNILLDSDMTPKISDFGMARIFSSNAMELNTTRIVGTHGYISPEYAFDGVCSVKSDVFSFGVLVLEIISGKRTTGFYPYDGKLYNLISYAWKLWRVGEWCQLVCCRIGNNHEMMERCIQVGLLCVQESAEDRPAMDHVLTMLNSKNVNLPKPKQPAYFFVRSSLLSSEPEVPSSNINISITLER